MNFKTIAYWAIIIFLAAIFVMGGVGKLTQMEVWQDRFVNNGTCRRGWRRSPVSPRSLAA